MACIKSIGTPSITIDDGWSDWQPSAKESTGWLNNAEQACCLFRAYIITSENEDGSVLYRQGSLILICGL